MALERMRGKAAESSLMQRAGELDRAIDELRRQRMAAMSLAEDAMRRRWRGTVEQALRESEENLRTILNISPLPIVWTDCDGNLEFQNRRARELFGYSPEEVATANSGSACPSGSGVSTRSRGEMELLVEVARREGERIGPLT